MKPKITQQEIDDVLAYLCSDDRPELFMVEVVDAAAEYFKYTVRDFCVQAVGGAIVFGGVNRLVWSPRFGFRCERSHCSPAFIARYEQLGPNPGRGT